MCDEKPCCVGHEDHLCELVKQGLPQKDPERYHGLVHEAEYVCKSCGRVAASKDNLCSPVELGTFE
jgi:hypothetical protein